MDKSNTKLHNEFSNPSRDDAQWSVIIQLNTHYCIVSALLLSSLRRMISVIFSVVTILNKPNNATSIQQGNTTKQQLIQQRNERNFPSCISIMMEQLGKQLHDGIL